MATRPGSLTYQQQHQGSRNGTRACHGETGLHSTGRCRPAAVGQDMPDTTTRADTSRVGRRDCILHRAKRGRGKLRRLIARAGYRSKEGLPCTIRPLARQCQTGKQWCLCSRVLHRLTFDGGLMAANSPCFEAAKKVSSRICVRCTRRSPVCLRLVSSSRCVARSTTIGCTMCSLRFVSLPKPRTHCGPRRGVDMEDCQLALKHDRACFTWLQTSYQFSGPAPCIREPEHQTRGPVSDGG